MRVALLHPCFWPEVRRGAERFARELADGLLARGHAPRLITSHRAGRTVAVEDGLEIVRAHRPPERPLRALGFEHFLTDAPVNYLELRRGDDELANPLSPVDGPGAVRWGRRTGRPVVFSYMGIPNAEWLRDKRLRWTMTERSVRGADVVVALSHAAARAFGDVFGVEARVIEPGVDVETFAPDDRGRAETPTVVCAADAGEYRKRVPLLVEALALVRRERPDARLRLSTPRGEEVRRRFAGIEGVELVDLDDRAALAEAYRRAWVSALPSFGEAFGLVLAEAMACGTPVVAADDGGMPEVLGGREDVGRLFRGEDAPALARALLEALELAEAPGTAAACREQALEFSTDRCADAYAALYAELAAYDPPR